MTQYCWKCGIELNNETSYKRKTKSRLCKKRGKPPLDVNLRKKVNKLFAEGLTQAKIAKQLEVNRGAVSHILNYVPTTKSTDMVAIPYVSICKTCNTIVSFQRRWEKKGPEAIQNKIIKLSKMVEQLEGIIEKKL